MIILTIIGFVAICALAAFVTLLFIQITLGSMMFSKSVPPEVWGLAAILVGLWILVWKLFPFSVVLTIGGVA